MWNREGRVEGEDRVEETTTRKVIDQRHRDRAPDTSESV
jgi:hypothetical protein